jgi:hypothetical protein
MMQLIAPASSVTLSKSVITRQGYISYFPSAPVIDFEARPGLWHRQRKYHCTIIEALHLFGWERHVRCGHLTLRSLCVISPLRRVIALSVASVDEAPVLR